VNGPPHPGPAGARELRFDATPLRAKTIVRALRMAALGVVCFAVDARAWDGEQTVGVGS